MPTVAAGLGASAPLKRRAQPDPKEAEAGYARCSGGALGFSPIKKKGGETMAIISRHLRASLRMVETGGDTIHSYHSINPAIQASQVENFLLAVNGLTGRTGGDAFLTVTTQLLEEVV